MKQIRVLLVGTRRPLWEEDLYRTPKRGEVIRENDKGRYYRVDFTISKASGYINVYVEHTR